MAIYVTLVWKHRRAEVKWTPCLLGDLFAYFNDGDEIKKLELSCWRNVVREFPFDGICKRIKWVCLVRTNIYIAEYVSGSTFLYLFHSMFTFCLKLGSLQMSFFHYNFEFNKNKIILNNILT